MGASGQFTSRGGNYYRVLLPQSQATSSQYALGYSKLISSPQSTSSQSTSALSSRKQYNSASQGSASPFGASTGFASQGMSSSYSESPSAPGSSPYASVSLSSPQAGPSTTVQGSRKRLTSTYTGSSGTQAGSSSFTLKGSTAYGGSRQPQDTASQFAPSSPYESVYCKCVLSPQGVDRHSTSVQSSQKQFTSSYGTQSGSSTPFTLQGSITFDGSPQPQGTASQFAPVSPSYPSVLSPSQGVASQSTIWGSLKQLTSTFAGSSDTQAGSSTPFALQGGTAYGGSSQPQDTTSLSAPGSHSSHASVSLSSPHAGPSTNVQGSLKRLASTFVGSSGTQAGSSTPFILQGSTAYGGSSQPLDTASQFSPGSPSSYPGLSQSSPQGVASHSPVQFSSLALSSRKQYSSGAQFGGSTGFASQGMSSSYSGSVQSQGTTSQFAPGSSPYASVSLSSPQAGPSTTVRGSLKQFTSTYTGSSGTQAGSATRFTLHGSTAYVGSHQPQDAASQFVPGSSFPYASVSFLPHFNICIDCSPFQSVKLAVLN
uniref:Uncharacterized protein n=1 Tax=Sinocyclocheilus rhinocerous TaxID=307959 RepID=A0A673KSK9_9TELE